MFEITVKSHFSGAHFLREYKGKCEQLHGHNWTVEATLCSETLDDSGMIYDFKILKKELLIITDEFDHTLLNDHPEFVKANPSAERIARFIFTRLKQAIQGEDIKVKEVCVHESESSRAVYKE